MPLTRVINYVFLHLLESIVLYAVAS